MRHLRKFDTQTNYNNVKSSLALPNVCLLNDIYEIASEGDEDIVPIEYLQSTGTQYISTNIIPDANTGIMLTITRLNNTDSYICGVRNDNGNTRWVLGCPNYSGYGSVITTSSYPAINIKYDVGLNYLNNKKFTIPLNNVETNLPTLPFTPTTDIRLFGSSGVNASYTKWTGKIYACKISQNNNIVMDLIPVRIGNVGYMFDNISKKLFGNSGTGNFTLGQDIVPIEYLESTGTQYIDTGIIVKNNNANLSVKYQFTESATAVSVFGAMKSNNTCWFAEQYGNKWWFGGTGSLFNNSQGTNLHTVKWNIANGTVNGTVDNTNYSGTYSGSIVSDVTLALFCTHYGANYSRNGKVKLYYFQLSENDKKLLDLIPVRIGTVGYMYDKVSRQLFGNVGSGSFTCGPIDTKRKITRNKQLNFI